MPECGQSQPHAQYATAPNDVWSLGVVLVNLTCGRNPWKKASLEDTTFRAFIKDPNFLRTILNITPELNHILERVFECDPRRRIGLDELRDLVMACPHFTTFCYGELPPSPPQTPVEYVAVDAMDCVEVISPSGTHSQGQGIAYSSHSSQWSMFEPSSKQNSNYSVTSSDSGYDSDVPYPEVSNNQPFNFYGNIIPFQDQAKAQYFAQQSYVATPIVAF